MGNFTFTIGLAVVSYFVSMDFFLAFMAWREAMLNDPAGPVKVVFWMWDKAMKNNIK